MGRKLIGYIALLNFVDLVSTICSIEMGFAEELNPLMAHAYSTSPLLFCVAKIAMVSLGLWVGWKNRKMKVVRKALSVVVTVYTALMGWHAAMWFSFVRG